MSKDINITDEVLVVFQPSGRRGGIQKGMTVLEAARQLGEDIESVCGGIGVCGKCRVRVECGLVGDKAISPPAAVEKDWLAGEMLKQGYRLACQVLVYGDIVVFVPEESRGGGQIIRKAAHFSLEKTDPAVRDCFVELAGVTVEKPAGDWERLQEALRQQAGVEADIIDITALGGAPGHRQGREIEGNCFCCGEGGNPRRRRQQGTFFRAGG